MAGFLAVLLAAGGTVYYLLPGLPDVQMLKNVQLQVPLRIYTRDGRLLGEFGEKRRTPVHLKDVPPIVVHAFLDAEDDRFYEHPGVDWQGLVRAIANELRAGNKRQGGSTITMQVARAFFLTPHKDYVRKAREILLALKIEQEFSKDEILELYLNTIFLGQRAYGIAAAAEVYYGTDMQHLRLDQVATIAGIPPAPTDYNPVHDPDAAFKRRSYVLRRLLEKGHVTQAQYDEAMRAPIATSLHGLPIEVEAPDMAEMVRSALIEKYGEETATTSGFRVYTTLDSRLQEAANTALRTALIDYDRRHGYRGAERHVDLPPNSAQTQWATALANDEVSVDLLPGIVTAVADKSIDVYTPTAGVIHVEWPGLSWAAPYIDKDKHGPAPKTARETVKVGDIVRVQLAADEEPGDDSARKKKSEAAVKPSQRQWRLAQIPAVQGALISMVPGDGAIRALVGGFDYAHSKFNRVTQARRQPGSNFKPFFYSAALDNGFTPASIINDAPIVVDEPGLEESWRPENYERDFAGPTRLREALTKSRNLVSIRLVREMGVDVALNYVRNFGFDVDRLPHSLSLALGTGELAPIEVARGYSVFANGGFLIEPYFIDHIQDAQGHILMQASPRRACHDCEITAPGAPAAPAPTDTTFAPRVINPQNCWMMTSIMRDVINYGTGQRARVLGRSDIAGKTGTTNDQRDAWFSGFNTQLETTVWVGFDQVQPLGKDETGAKAALPMWIDFMRVALEGMPESLWPQPPGLVTVRIDPQTGLLARPDDPAAIFETFREEQVPTSIAPPTSAAVNNSGTPGTSQDSELF
ncbi:MAG TPA: penicillin-binding protein 1A [Gammaproteobacteria bacterium]|nr:penicillin-binding protein 1A [Gammaproteobacteria bacterium]